ncbi:hypothetical protein [Lacisediminimonas sp.]|nr:hypothetical protein [Lacisediminimonas sp.]
MNGDASTGSTRLGLLLALTINAIFYPASQASVEWLDKSMAGHLVL